MDGSLTDRVALITGSARGIGRAVSARFLAEGARVVLVDLAGSQVETTSGLLDAAGDSTLTLTADVTREEDIRHAVAAAKERFGRIDILVNNAGIAPMRSFLETDMELYDRVMAVNARGSFMMARECARDMATRRWGSIVQLASTCAFQSGASQELSAYNMSKAAVRQMVPSLASELAEYDIRVNAVAPGTIDTEMTRSCMPDEASVAAATQKIPLGKLGQPKDIAAACAFLCSEEARYITGHTLVVDGGWLVR
jgi:NAD(P)-dependent dehydrogenase (short-subunit alcohol dehydrogenase family)